MDEISLKPLQGLGIRKRVLGKMHLGFCQVEINWEIVRTQGGSPALPSLFIFSIRGFIIRVTLPLFLASQWGCWSPDGRYSLSAVSIQKATVLHIYTKCWCPPGPVPVRSPSSSPVSCVIFHNSLTSMSFFVKISPVEEGMCEKIAREELSLKHWRHQHKISRIEGCRIDQFQNLESGWNLKFLQLDGTWAVCWPSVFLFTH